MTQIIKQPEKKFSPFGFKPETLIIDGEEKGLVDLNNVIGIQLNAGEHIVETNYSRPRTIKIISPKTVRFKTMYSNLYLSIILIVALVLILKYGFGINKIFMFDYVRYTLIFCALACMLMLTIGKKYVRKIVVVP